jgi:hypothetical protein
LRFKISQHSRDELLIKNLVNYLGCGWYEYQKDNTGSFVCSNITEINNKIIPFFNKYPPMGLKLLNYKDWCKAVEIINDKGHLTSIGLDMIIKIKAGMNSKRD